jgi:hypothetical protein
LHRGDGRVAPFGNGEASDRGRIELSRADQDRRRVELRLGRKRRDDLASDQVESGRRPGPGKPQGIP